MQLWLRLLLIATILFSFSSFVWFLLGATAYFQRGMDIIGTTLFLGADVPVLLFVGLFTILLIKGRTPANRGQYIMLFIGLLISILISVGLIQSVSTYGWANEKVESDSVQVTVDNKYEYRIDLINLFQKNSYSRLYLKDLDSGKEIYVPIDIKTRKIIGLGVSKVNHWVMLEPTDTASEYILSTTKDLGIPEEKFEIDVATGTSR